MIRNGKHQEREQDTILWLTGWSMPNTIFNKLHAALPGFHHVCVNYSNVESPEEMSANTETEYFNSAVSNHSRVLIAGWSLGGLLAMRLAAKGLAHGLVLLSSTGRFTRPKTQQNLGWSDAYIRQMISALNQDRQAVENKFREMLFSDLDRNDGLTGTGTLPLNSEWTTEALIVGLQVLRQMDFISHLPEMDCPVLLIHGTEDRICPYAAAEEMNLLMPRARLMTVSGGGHVPFLGREASIAHSIRRWWDEQQNPSHSASV